MRFFTLFLLLTTNIYSQDLSFQQIKKWNSYEYFEKNIFENYWNVSQSSRFFIKATHFELGEIFYYKEDTPDNVANTFEIRLLSREMMMNIRKEILAECRFIRTFKIDENVHSFYNCKDKQYFGLIGIGIVSDKSGNQIYSILNKELFIN